MKRNSVKGKYFKDWCNDCGDITYIKHYGKGALQSDLCDKCANPSPPKSELYRKTPKLDSSKENFIKGIKSEGKQIKEKDEWKKKIEFQVFKIIFLEGDNGGKEKTQKYTKPIIKIISSQIRSAKAEGYREGVKAGRIKSKSSWPKNARVITNEKVKSYKK